MNGVHSRGAEIMDPHDHDLPPPWRHDPLVFVTGPEHVPGDYRAPIVDPHYDDGRPAQLDDIAMGVRADLGGWSEDFLAGWRIYIREQDTEAHESYTEPWGVELSNDIDLTSGMRVPWDYGLAAPRAEYLAPEEYYP